MLKGNLNLVEIRKLCDDVIAASGRSRRQTNKRCTVQKKYKASK